MSRPVDSSAQSDDQSTSVLSDKKWYRQFWPWFIVLLPASVVIASMVTLGIAIENRDYRVDQLIEKDGFHRSQVQQDQQMALAQELRLSAVLYVEGGLDRDGVQGQGSENEDTVLLPEREEVNGSSLPRQGTDAFRLLLGLEGRSLPAALGLKLTHPTDAKQDLYFDLFPAENSLQPHSLSIAGEEVRQRQNYIAELPVSKIQQLRGKRYISVTNHPLVGVDKPSTDRAGKWLLSSSCFFAIGSKSYCAIGR